MRISSEIFTPGSKLNVSRPPSSFYFFIPFFSIRTLAVGVRCHASYFHARTRRLHLLKAIHYDSKIISFDLSRQWRGRHPIKSYVAASETTIRIRRTCLYIPLVHSSCVPIAHFRTCLPFFFLHFPGVSSQRFLLKSFNQRNFVSPNGREFVNANEKEKNFVSFPFFPRCNRNTSDERQFKGRHVLIELSRDRNRLFGNGSPVRAGGYQSRSRGEKIGRFICKESCERRRVNSSPSRGNLRD